MENIKNWFNKNFDKLGYLALVMFFVVFHLILFLRMDLIIDSDLSSEMVYAKLCAQENTLLTNSWFYSTELRIFSMNIVLIPLFGVFNNWKVIRLLGTAICNFLIVLSFIYLGKKFRLKYLGWLSILVVGSISEEYYRFITSSMCYSVFIVSALFSLGLMVKLSDDRYNKIYWIALELLVFLTSLNGMRTVVIFSLPVFVSAILLWLYYRFIGRERSLDKLQLILKMSFIVLIVSAAGYLINVLVLSKIYVFESYTGIDIELNFGRLSEVVLGWLSVFGMEPAVYFTNIKFIMMPLFIGLVALIFMSIVIVISSKKYSLMEKFVGLTFLMSCCAVSAVFIISNQYFAPRYLLTSFALYAIVIALCLNKADLKINKLIVLCCVLFVSVNSASLSISYGNSKNNEIKDVIDILKEDEINKVYTSFWEGNVLTELAGGEIEAYVLEKDTHNINRWLQKQEHYNNPEIAGKVYLVFEEKYKRDLSIDSNEYIVYQGNEIVMYCFENYNQMISYFVV